MIEILQPTPDNIARVCQGLQNGEAIALPTETVYGLAADALNPKAVRSIFAIKGRPLVDPLIVHVHDIGQAGQLAEIPEAIRQLTSSLWPGPLTVVVPRKPVITDLITAGQPTVALRCPAHPIMREVLLRSKLALAAPSANPFGYVSPTTAAHVADSLGDRLGTVIDGGPCAAGLESTIVRINPTERVLEILRPGPIDEAQLSAAAPGFSVQHFRQSMPKPVNGAELAPGMMNRHYSPGVPLVLVPQGEQAPNWETLAANHLANNGPAVAYVGLSRKSAETAATALTAFCQREIQAFWLSENGNLEEAARSLFAMLRNIDQAGCALAFFESPAESTGISHSIHDRLERAAAS